MPLIRRSSTWRCAAILLLTGLQPVITTPSLAQPRIVREAAPVARTSYDMYVAEAATRFALPPAWIAAVIHAESAGDARAISPKGAMGLMQIMPATWAYLHDRYRLGADPYDPHDNIVAGAAYIRLLLDRYGAPGWIAAYNAGPARYAASLTGRPLPPETRTYVPAVAPILGFAAPVAATAPDPLVWTRAALFAGGNAASATSAAHKDDPPDAPGLATDGLFVRTSGAGRP